MDRPTGKSALRFLIMITIVFGVVSLAALAGGRVYASRAKAEIRASGSMGQLAAAVNAPEYRLARRLNKLSNLLFVGFVISLVATIVVKRGQRE